MKIFVLKCRVLVLRARLKILEIDYGEEYHSFKTYTTRKGIEKQQLQAPTGVQVLRRVVTLTGGTLPVTKNINGLSLYAAIMQCSEELTEFWIEILNVAPGSMTQVRRRIQKEIDGPPKKPGAASKRARKFTAENDHYLRFFIKQSSNRWSDEKLIKAAEQFNNSMMTGFEI